VSDKCCYDHTVIVDGFFIMAANPSLTPAPVAVIAPAPSEALEARAGLFGKSIV
jgi:hypothetical protein